MSAPFFFLRLSIAALLCTACARALPPLEAPSSSVSSPTDARRVSVAELRRLQSSGVAVTIIDVGPPEAFEREHIPGAISIPVDEVARRRHEIERDRPVITYCG